MSISPIAVTSKKIGIGSKIIPKKFYKKIYIVKNAWYKYYMDNSELIPIDQFVPVLKEVPDEVKRLIDMLADPNNRLSDVDEAFGWESGEAARKLRAYPLLRRTVEEARVLGLRRVGIEKEDAYRVYKDALEAQRPVGESGELIDDHEVRIKAADRILGLMGEKPMASSNTVQVGLQINMSDGEREELERLRRGIK